MDIPGLQTVFLTRPTQSEILLRQMVGRALRGPKADGTREAYLVSFEDHWVRFRELESPFGRLLDIFPPEVPKPDEPEVPHPPRTGVFESESYKLIQAAAAELRRVGGNQPIDVFEAVPHGWFILERPTETECEEGQDAVHKVIHVYEHQKACWDALIAYLDLSEVETRADTSVPALFSAYFGDCDAPQPSDHSVEQLLEHYRAGGEKPLYHDMADRKRVDPHEVARRLYVDKEDRITIIEECYKSPLVQLIYPEHSDYVAAVDRAIYDLQYPGRAVPRPRPGIPVFEPSADQQLRPPPGPGPAHDLAALMKGVLEDGKALLKLPTLPFAATLEWSARLIKGWYGKAYWEKHVPFGSGTIRVNCLLNSPDVTAATMRFLLWHEYLHLYLQQFHTPKFRELEARWPGRIDADRELNTLSQRFGIAYW